MGSYYPDLGSALPSGVFSTTCAAKMLPPAIVLTAISILAAASVVVVGVAASVLSSNAERTRSVDAVQALGLVAAAISVVYLAFHGLAARYNDPVGVSRPPERKLHATCFIVARLGLVFWIASFIASLVVVATPNACLAGSNACKLQIADVIASVLGFIATGIILTALESCKYPFGTPAFLKIKTESRGDPFDSIMDRSVSRDSSFDSGEVFDSDKLTSVDPQKGPEKGIQRKPLLRAISEKSAVAERPTTPLLVIRGRAKSVSNDWGEEHALRSNVGVHKQTESLADSAISLSDDTSSESSCYTSKSSSRQSSDFTIPRKAVIARRPVSQRSTSRRVTPSSSISNHSRRSPLSSVRSAEYPHILVRPELRYYPPIIPPPHGWSPSKTSSMAELIPVALERLPSLPKHHPASHRARTPLSRKNTNEVRVPRAYRQSFLDYDENMDEHVRQIELEYRRSQRKRVQGPRNFVKREAGNFDRLNPPPRRAGSQERYQEKRTVEHVQRSAPVAKIVPNAACPATATAEKVEPVTVGEFKRLSLGDFSVGLESLMGFGDMFD
ncbi:hypothetical protein LZ554_008748 [Drepanopeziza brunnea f. sp. 'monogermtubi']|nr:hypothetical protein LZ554_008748 [Drepanopeziza brunnea f. sp. 'monogermtubi']